ncbi:MULTISPECIES: hypothetical protein [Xanthomonas]|uniref:hypothetical protein n=1 Tax=Xanthomonas TaxID=338 RepID=UPI0012900CEB|nr:MULTISPECIES: hypothetical protein [Xanthomonas]
MKKFAAIIVLGLVAGVASAHQDRILPIGADGALGAIPDRYGPVKVRISRAAENSGALTGVAITSPHFNIVLSQCILSKLKGVTHIQASGSWYHTRGSLPPYASLTFYSGEYDPRSPANEYYSVTFSLFDGHILMGQRAWYPIIGDWRAQVIDPADKCSYWQKIGMWPNNSFKPNLLRGSA